MGLTLTRKVHMDIGLKEMLLTAKLNERNIIYRFRNDNGLNSFDLDILLFAHRNQVFNIYDARRHFEHTNVQQILRSIKKLNSGKYLELLRPGIKGRPALYWLSGTGELMIEHYTNLLVELFN